MKIFTLVGTLTLTLMCSSAFSQMFDYHEKRQECPGRLTTNNLVKNNDEAYNVCDNYSLFSIECAEDLVFSELEHNFQQALKVCTTSMYSIACGKTLVAKKLTSNISSAVGICQNNAPVMMECAIKKTNLHKRLKINDALKKCYQEKLSSKR